MKLEINNNNKLNDEHVKLCEYSMCACGAQVKPVVIARYNYDHLGCIAAAGSATDKSEENVA